MFLHIGTDIEIMKKDIIVVIDIKSVENSDINSQFFNRAKKEGRVVNIIQQPKSVILVNHMGEEKIYLSPISSSTIQKRMAEERK